MKKFLGAVAVGVWLGVVFDLGFRVGNTDLEASLLISLTFVPIISVMIGLLFADTKL